MGQHGRQSSSNQIVDKLITFFNLLVTTVNVETASAVATSHDLKGMINDFLHILIEQKLEIKNMEL